jgi:hypothetical protein
MPGYRRWRGGPMIFLMLVTALRQHLFAAATVR